MLSRRSSFAGSTIIFFFMAANIIRWFGHIVALPRWTWLLLLLKYFFIDNCTWWYLRCSSCFTPQLFPLNFTVTNLWVTRSLRHLCFLGKLFSGVSSDDNSYCKKHYSKAEVGIVEITQVRLQKMKMKIAKPSFYCLVSENWEKNFAVIRKEKSAWFVLFLKRKKLR